jgi:hypothetical protein
MVSPLHEGVIKLVRDRPAFAADLLGELLDVKVPRFRRARLGDATLNQLAPVELRADAVVLFSQRKKPVFGAIFEAQIKRDRRKRFTWPLYATAARAREKCPFVVLVVSPSAATARWAAQPIELGGGNQYSPLVIGPDGIPKVTQRDRARRAPQLAVLSVMAHGRGEVGTATAIGTAAVRAISRFPDDERLLYSLLIDSNLSKAARKAIAMQPGTPKYFSEAQRRNYERGVAEGEAKGKAEGEAKGKAEGEAKGKAEGEAKGKAEGKAEALLKILTQRGLSLTAEQRRRIAGCADLAVLERWLDRALSVRSATDLLASHARTRRSVHHGTLSAQTNGRRKSR